VWEVLGLLQRGLFFVGTSGVRHRRHGDAAAVIART
jgi:hypothetical protein